VRNGLERADPKHFPRAGAKHRDIGLRSFETCGDRRGVREQHLALLGQLDETRAAESIDEPRSGDSFECEDLAADGRLRVPEGRRGRAERALARNGLERCEMAQLDAVPPRLQTRRSHEQDGWSERSIMLIQTPHAVLG
jgi:hypothetical protein